MPFTLSGGTVIVLFDMPDFKGTKKTIPAYLLGSPASRISRPKATLPAAALGLAPVVNSTRYGILSPPNLAAISIKTGPRFEDSRISECVAQLFSPKARIPFSTLFKIASRSNAETCAGVMCATSSKYGSGHVTFFVIA